VWQINCAPAFQAGIGPLIQGNPARHSAGDATGQYLVTMTWGGGGVSYQTEFEYPAAGASFCVSGDNVMLTAISRDFFNVYTEQTKPCIQVWAMPRPYPLSPHPLTETFTAGGGPSINEIPPWARTMTVTKTDPLATVLIEMAFGVVNTFTTVANMTAADQFIQLPIPSTAIQVRLTASLGSARGMFDLVFT
jgi:hypothetical protein